MGIFSTLNAVRDEIRELPGIGNKPRGGVGSYFQAVGPALRLALVEREIFLFALAQWAAVAFGYLLWVEGLNWIPESVWQAASESKSGNLGANLLLLGWSFLCVGAVAFPLGVFSACMGAAHLLYRRGEHSSIARCLLIVLPRGWALWGFHWADGWVTVNQILERLPSKNRKRGAARALSEALYYAWKLGIAGVLPSLVHGCGLVESGLNSVSFVQARLREVALLRGGYSLLCWVVGILAYVGAFVVIKEVGVVPAGEAAYQHIHAIYAWAGIPVVIAAAVVLLLLRPVYVIALCELYAQHQEQSGKRPAVAPSPPPALSAVVAFLFLAALVVIAYLFAERAGIGDWLDVR